MENVDKVIVTNVAALKSKYGKAWAEVNKAIRSLIKADEARGICTRLIDMSSDQHMSRCGTKAVSTPSSERTPSEERQNKKAIDKIAQTYEPSYLLILGSTDVVPHQTLVNPLYHSADKARLADPDEYVPSDLPYACERGYSRHIEDFLNISRVIGRLPDVTDAKEPAVLINVLGTAAKAKDRSQEAYASYLGISCEVWSGSTSESVSDIFHSTADLNTSPPAGPQWTAAQLGTRLHYVNCHGVNGALNFFGQSATGWSVALESGDVRGKISEGTVAVVECCYGAQLFKPDPSLGNVPPMSISYLSSSAYGYFGSTTTAYGPATGNDNADLICKYFAEHVMLGASLGRAALEAQHAFVCQGDVLHPVDLKTLAQFILLGDPSIQPVTAAQQSAIELMSSHKRGASAERAKHRLAVTKRRASLKRRARLISRNVQAAVTKSQKPSDKKIQAALERAAKQYGVSPGIHLSYEMSGPGEKHPHRTHVAISSHTPRGAPATQLQLIVAHERDGGLEIKALSSK